MEFMGGEGQHINILFLHMNGQMPCCLYSIGMEQHAFFFTQCTDLGNGLNAADLVVGIHNSHQTGIFPNGCRHFLRRHNAVLMHIQQSNLKALLLHLFQGVQYSMMFKSGGNDMFFPFTGTVQSCRDNSLIIGLTAAGCKIDFIWLTAQYCCHCLPGSLQSVFCSLTYRM